MISMHTKFEMSAITCNEDIKSNTNCKDSGIEPPFGEFRGNARVHLRRDGKRIVDFLSVVIEHFLLALTAEALLSEICRNRHFLTRVVHFDRKF